jgi:phosphoglycerate dehydrogenase-like enzyme
MCAAGDDRDFRFRNLPGVPGRPLFMSDIRVHISSNLNDEQLAQFAAVSPRVQLSYRPALPYYKPTDVEPELEQAEVLIGYHAYFTMDKAPRLKWMQLTSDGADHLRGMPIMKSDVIMTNTRVFAVPITEYVFGSMLSWFYQFPKMREEFQTKRIYPKNQWEEYRSDELEGKTLAIIGHGAIGQHLAQVAQVFGMNVIATRRSVSAPTRQDGVDVYPAESLKEVLARGDVVVVTLPLTDETEGIIGEAELRAMKPNAYLVSVGRGKVIQEPVLVRALKEKWFAGAGLDVYAQRPLPPDSPFFDLPNVIMTPHMSGVSNGYTKRGTAFLCENLRRYVAGEPLLNLVDKQKGY